MKIRTYLGKRKIVWPLLHGSPKVIVTRNIINSFHKKMKEIKINELTEEQIKKSIDCHRKKCLEEVGPTWLLLINFMLL